VHTASIIRVMNLTALIMEAIGTSETSVYFNRTTWRYIPESCHLRIRFIYKARQKNRTHFTHPLHRDEECMREETGCVLSGRKKHLVSIEHWTAARRAFGVEVYFKNHETMVKTCRLFRRQWGIKNTIKSWVQTFRETAPTMKRRSPGRSHTVRTPENVNRVLVAVLPSLRRSARRQSVALQLPHSPRGFKFSPLQGPACATVTVSSC
jgi:hypothetical protein